MDDTSSQAQVFNRTWIALDNDDERTSLESHQQMEGLHKTYKELRESSKIENSPDLDQRRAVSVSCLQMAKSAIPEGFPFQEGEKIDADFVLKMMKFFKKDEVLPYRIASRILSEALPLLKANLAHVDIQIPQNGKIVVVGDLHGQYLDLCTVLDLGGFPSEKNSYIFNGDLVDRGPHGPEVVFTIYALKIAYPHNVFINRGNHELLRMNEKYDFKNQMLEKYDNDMFLQVSETFLWLPFSSLINKVAFVVHGGLFQYDDVTLQELHGLVSELGKPVPTHKALNTRNRILVENMLWSDPDPTAKKSERNVRGAGILFGSDQVKKFITNNNLQVVIRSHQLVDEGYQKLFEGSVITVFSASCYASKNDNKGAIAIFTHDQSNWKEPQFIQYYGSLLGKSQEKLKLDQKQETLHKLYERIYDNSHSLRLAFEKQSIPDKKGLITYKSWESVLSQVLNLNLEWPVLYHYLVLPKQKEDDLINYTRFLDRFSVNLDERLTEWQDDVVNGLVTGIVNRSQSLGDAFKEYDTNRDGLISYQEFWEVMKKWNFGESITEQQCYDIMSSIDTDRNGFIDYPEFKLRFGPKFARFNSASDWVKNAVAELSKNLIVKHKNIKQSFLTFDADHDNRITYKEFITVLQRDLGVNNTPEQFKQLFDYVDENASGAISYKEFKTAFEGANAEKFAKRQNFEVSAKNMIMYRMCTAIRYSKTQLHDIWKEADVSKEGHISLNEFLHALQALNIICKADPDLAKHALAEEQTKKLHAIMDKKGKGWIDYRDFLKMFEIKVS